MLGLLAQSTTYTYTTTNLDSVDDGALGALGAFLAVYVIAVLAMALVTVISMWKIFEKAGEKGWKALIPVYNFWTLCEVAGRPGWWSLVVLLSFIPVINFIAWIAVLAVSIIVYIDLSKAFGKEAVFAVLLVLLPIIGLPILAFGSAKYTKPATVKKA